jgi:L-iditol 2-dehydrogenase
MAAVGICGSDVHYYVTGKINRQVVEYPFVLGHEGAGVVAEVGPGVTKVKPGQRVAIEPAMPCFDCDQCRIGRVHTCRNLRFLACPGQAEGCLQEYIVVPETSCLPIADTVGMEGAAFSEPLAIGVYAVDISIPMDKARIAILGSGPIGLSVFMPALAGGAERIYVTDKIDERVAFARSLGAGWAANPEKEDIIEAIAGREPLGLDAVFECCGQQEAISQALCLLKPGGKLMVIGIPRENQLLFDMDYMRRREICVQNVRRQVNCTEKALKIIEDGKIPIDKLITHRFSLEQAGEAFELVDSYSDGVIKAVVNIV